jgi:hypothetical protein
MEVVWMFQAVRRFSLALTTLAGLIGSAQALPLSPDECERARSEQAGLETAGVTQDMAQKPEWARANLSSDRLKRIARWIELEEQVLFRCPRPKLVKAPESASDDSDPVGSEEKPKEKKAVQKSKPQPVGIEAASGDGAEPAAPKPAKKKPKSADAYKPPIPFSGEVLQHAAPGLSVPAPNQGLAP